MSRKGSRATNPSVRQRNEVFTTAAAADTSVIDAWIHQALGGVSEYEIAEARQEGTVEQSNLMYSPASQSDLLNHATWNGVEPPADDVGGPVPNRRAGWEPRDGTGSRPGGNVRRLPTEHDHPGHSAGQDDRDRDRRAARTASWSRAT